MSKHETPMIIRYWETVGGTIAHEFQLVPKGAGAARRLADAVILPKRERRTSSWRDMSLDGEDVIVVQAKARRLGMNVMGQAVFSAELIRRRFKPASVRSVLLCGQDDAVLRPLLDAYPEVEVVMMPGIVEAPVGPEDVD